MKTDIVLHYTNILLIFTSLFFAVFLLFLKSKNKAGNILLSIFLIVRIIDVIPSTFTTIQLNPYLDVLRMDLGAFFQAPLLFLFVKSVIYSDFKLSPKDILWFSPFFISTGLLLPSFYFADKNEQLIFYNQYTSTFQGKFSYVLAHLQNLFYIIITFILLHHYKKLIQENYSKNKNTNYSWLFYLNVISLILFVFALVKNAYRFGNHFGYINFLRLLTSVIMLGFTYWLIFKALNAPQLFKGIPSNLQLVSNFKNEISNPKIELLKKQKLELKKYMLKEEPYLNPELTIKSLASKINMEERELSVLINTKLNLNFYEFINQYRIKKAKEILQNSKFANLTILEILYKVGYNSKSSFNTEFKKDTGLTPTEFRKKFLKKEF